MTLYDSQLLWLQLGIKDSLNDLVVVVVRDTRQGRNSVQSALKDVVGDPRQEPISLPSYFGAGRPGAIPNQKVRYCRCTSNIYIYRGS